MLTIATAVIMKSKQARTPAASEVVAPVVAAGLQPYFAAPNDEFTQADMVRGRMVHWVHWGSEQLYWPVQVNLPKLPNSSSGMQSFRGYLTG